MKSLSAMIGRWLRCLGVGDEKRPSLLMIGLFAAASLIMIGYRFAVWDQLLYLSCVDRFFLPIVDNPNDLYLRQFLWRTYTTFWILYFPIKQALGWEWSLFLIYLVAKFFLLWGIWSITLTLTKDRATAWIALLLMLANKAIMGGGVQLYMQDTITRYVVLPFLLFGIQKLWERKYITSAILFGLAFQVHAMSAVFWILSVVLAAPIYWWGMRGTMPQTAERRAECKRMLWGAIVFALLALPMLIWVAKTPLNPAGDFTTREYMDFIQTRHGYVFFANHTAVDWKNLLLAVLLIVLGYRRMPTDGISRWYMPWTLGIMGVLLVHFLAADVFMYQPIYKMQMGRIVDLLGFLGVIGAARILAVHALGDWRQRWLAALSGALLLSGVIAPGWNAEFFATGVLFVFLLELEPVPGRFSFPALAILAIFLAFPLLHQPISMGRRGLQSFAWPVERVSVFGIIFALGAACFSLWKLRQTWARHLVSTLCVAGVLTTVCFERAIILEQKSWTRGMDPDANKTYWQKIVTRTQEKIDWPGHGMDDDWIQLQLWVRDNTPPGSIFFTPPGLNGFRVFSQRGVFFESYDAEPAIFQPAYTKELIERFKAFDYWPPSDRSSEKADLYYHSQREDDWEELATLWDVPYVITSRPVRLPFPKLRQQGRFTLWKIEEPVTTP